MSRVARNTSAVAAAFLSNTLLYFIQIKLLTRYLPQSELGEYSATVAIGAIVAVLAQIGLPVVVLRFTAKYDAFGNPAQVRRLLVLGWGLVSGLSILLIAAEATLAPTLLARLYSVPPSSASVLLATAVFLTVALRQITYAGFDGLRKMSYPAVLENLNVAAITMAIAVSRDRLTVPLLLGMTLASGLATFLVATVLLLGLLRRPAGAAAAATPSEAPPPLLADITPFWRGAAVNGLIGIGLGYADKLLVSLFLSFQMVSIFFVAERVTFLLKRLLAMPLQVASPEITRRWELGRREELRQDAAFLLKIQFALGVLVTSLVFVASEAAVLVVANPSFLEAAGLLRLLTISVVLMALYAPITTILRAIERIDLALLSDVLWLGLYVGLGIVLMPRFGLTGIALAQVAASAGTALWNVIAGRRAAGIAWDVRALGRILGCGLLGAAPGYAAVRLLGPGRPFAGIAVALAASLVYGLILVRSGVLTPADRGRLKALAGTGRVAVLLDRALFRPARLRSSRPTNRSSGRDPG